MTLLPPADAGRTHSSTGEGVTRGGRGASGMRLGTGPGVAPLAGCAAQAVLAPHAVPGPVTLLARHLAADLFTVAIRATDLSAAAIHGALWAGHNLNGVARLLQSTKFTTLSRGTQIGYVSSVVAVAMKALRVADHGL